MSVAGQIKYKELPCQLGRHSLQSNIMPDSAQKLWQIAFAGETIKAQCFETFLKVYAVAATSLLRWRSLCMHKGRSDGGISVYIPPKSVYLKKILCGCFVSLQ